MLVPRRNLFIIRFLMNLGTRDSLLFALLDGRAGDLYAVGNP